MTGAQAVTTTTQAAIAAALPADAAEFNAAEIVAIAHLYRGEMYRSKVWRTRLDPTTNLGGGDDRHRHHGVLSCLLVLVLVLATLRSQRVDGRPHAGRAREDRRARLAATEIYWRRDRPRAYRSNGGRRAIPTALKHSRDRRDRLVVTQPSPFRGPAGQDARSPLSETPYTK
jgi:hypothetical protein